MFARTLIVPSAASSLSPLVAPLLAALIGAGAAAPAVAGDRLFLGAASIQTHSSARDMSGMAVPSGLNLSTGDAATVGLAWEHDLDAGWAAEVEIGVPPRLQTRAAGPGWRALGVAPGSVISETRAIFPTVFMNYHIPAGERWDPFVGIGINYTHFDGETALPPMTSRMGPTTIALADSWGLAAHAGVRLRLDPRWSLFASVAAMDIGTDMTATSTSPLNPGLVTSRATTHVDLHPVVYAVGVTREF